MTWDCKWSFNYGTVDIFLYADWVGTGICQLLGDPGNGGDRILSIPQIPLGSREKKGDREVTRLFLKFLVKPVSLGSSLEILSEIEKGGE